ncbi:MAG: acyl-CoA dehydrogenase family protein [Gammaproteobacteria bacterium]|nr:acyl-CoA dehydrogenase family protein [Gammaproteobacteria bacterium]MBK9428423.1 acyl-CoA dehydrogenase family protein [Gammaproteobacteria bacterium]
MEDISLQAKIDVLTEQQVLIQDSAVAFVEGDEELKRVRANRFVQPGFDRASWSEMAEAGWLGFVVPEEYGGVGLTFSDLALVLIQLGKGLVPAPFVATAVLAARTLAGSDNAALRAERLPQLVAGDWLPALAWQEARASLDVKARQVVYANGKLNGRKVFVPDAGGADAFIVSAAVPDGTALYLVDKDAPGLSLEFEQRVDGGFYGHLNFADTPVGAQVAAPERSEALLATVLDEARVAASAELLGVMTRALEISVDYLKQRVQFDKPIGSFQALQHKTVDLFILSEVSRSVLLQTTALFDGDADATQRAVAASQVKARCSDAALRIGKDAIQLHGGIGYTDECNIGLYLKKAMYLASWLGSASAHRARYADLTLGAAQ